MADDIVFNVQIENLPQVLAAFKEAPDIATEVFQEAIVATNLIFIQHTDETTVPYQSTNLIHSFRFQTQVLKAMWGPSADYAAAVEFGMPPSPGRYVPAIGKRLVDPSRPGFGMWPGFKANPYMERIQQMSESGVTELFTQALGKFAQTIADQANS